MGFTSILIHLKKVFAVIGIDMFLIINPFLSTKLRFKLLLKPITLLLILLLKMQLYRTLLGVLVT